MRLCGVRMAGLQKLRPLTVSLTGSRGIPSQKPALLDVADSRFNQKHSWLRLGGMDANVLCP